MLYYFITIKEHLRIDSLAFQHVKNKWRYFINHSQKSVKNYINGSLDLNPEIYGAKI